MAILGNSTAGMSGLAQDLASLDEYPKKRGAAGGDGTEPKSAGGTALAKRKTADLTEGEDASPFGPDWPTLADVMPRLRFQTIDQLVRSQDRLARNRWNIDQAHDWCYRGIPYGRLEKIPNQSLWVSKLPNGMTKESPAATPNKARDLTDKVTDALMADPAKLLATPPSHDMQAEEQAEFTTDYLRRDGGEQGTDDIGTYRWALLTSLIRATTFLHYRVDPVGGGYQPLQVLAHPLATDAANPMVAMVPVAGGMPDPVTGEVPTVQERSPNPIMRYVSADNQFVEDAKDADRVWVPKHVIERMRREQVRVFPPQKRAEDADAVILLCWATLAELVQRMPETVGKMGLTELQNLATWRPAMTDQYLVPFAFWGMQDGQTGAAPEEVGIFSPVLTKRVYWYRMYVKACPSYPEGYWADVSGMDGGTDLASGTMEYEVETPQHGKDKRCRTIPMVQMTPMLDPTDGDPMGWAFISRVSGGAEAEATIWAAALDRLDNELHPHVIIPSTTPIDEDDWADRTVPIITHPDAKPPTYEQFPPFLPVTSLMDRLDQKLDTVAGLGETAQALESSNASSGVAKSLTIQQAKVYLSQFQQELHRAMARGGVIKCENTQAEFSTPQLVKYSGEEGSAGPVWWTGKNVAFGEIQIAPGTGTMMTPEGKAQYTAFNQGQGWMSVEDAADVVMSGTRSVLGIPEPPVEQALEREIGVWLQGPEEGWEEQYAVERKQYDMAVQQSQQAYQGIEQEAAAAGVAPPMMPQLPAFQSKLPSPFPARPNDNEPLIAKAIAKRLSKLFFDPQYSALKAKLPGWGTLPDQKYAAAVQALTPPAPVAPMGGGDANAGGGRPVPVASPIQGPQPKLPGGAGGPQSAGRAA